jgi:ribose-phosphate pyrophosphokinase
MTHPRIAVLNAGMDRYVLRPGNGLKFMTFPGGEPHVKVGIHDHLVTDAGVSVDARLTSFTDMGYLLVLADYLNRNGFKLATLFMPYFPGGRQDRGAPLTVKIYSDMVLSMGFDNVKVLDPHSYVTTAMLGASTVTLTPSVLAKQHYDRIVCPDAGAQHRSEGLSRRMGVPGELVQCLKHRDPTTGELSGFKVTSDASAEHARFLLADDICDGGGTFLGVRDRLLEKFPNASVDLFVTHGIFSKGTDQLLGKFDRIFSTTSFLTFDQLTDLNVTPIKLYPQEVI